MFVAGATYARIAFALICILPLSLLFPIARAQHPPGTAFDLDGKPYDPFQHADGSVVVFLFVRTDCPISNRYAPTIQELSSRFDKHAQFFLVYPVRSETAQQIRKHLKEYGYNLPALRDPDLHLVHAAAVKVTPESAIFSADGRLLYHGRIDDWYSDFGRARPAPTTHDLSLALQAALAGKPIAVTAVPAIGCFLPDTQ